MSGNYGLPDETVEPKDEAPFKVYKATVHLKHTGTELICDVLSINAEGRFISIRNPTILQQISSGNGEAQMGLVPFLMTVKDDTIHLNMGDILFLSETRTEIADQHTGMFSQIIQPQGKGKIIL